MGAVSEGNGTLGYWRPGDRDWTWWIKIPPEIDATFYQFTEDLIIGRSDEFPLCILPYSGEKGPNFDAMGTGYFGPGGGESRRSIYFSWQEGPLGACRFLCKDGVYHLELNPAKGISLQRDFFLDLENYPHNGYYYLSDNSTLFRFQSDFGYDNEEVWCLDLRTGLLSRPGLVNCFGPQVSPLWDAFTRQAKKQVCRILSALASEAGDQGEEWQILSALLANPELLAIATEKGVRELDLTDDSDFLPLDGPRPRSNPYELVCWSLHLGREELPDWLWWDILYSNVPDYFTTAIAQAVGEGACKRMLEFARDQHHSSGINNGRHDSARVLFASVGPPAGPIIEQALDDPCAGVVAVAAWASGHYDEDECSSPIWRDRKSLPKAKLLDLLVHDSPFVQAAAMNSLGKMNFSEGFPAMISGLSNPNSYIRGTVLGTFGEYNGLPPESENKILQLVGEDPNANIRYSALGLALRYLYRRASNPCDLNPLINALSDIDERVRRFASDEFSIVATRIDYEQFHRAADSNLLNLLFNRCDLGTRIFDPERSLFSDLGRALLGSYNCPNDFRRAIDLPSPPREIFFEMALLLPIIYALGANPETALSADESEALLDFSNALGYLLDSSIEDLAFLVEPPVVPIKGSSRNRVGDSWADRA